MATKFELMLVEAAKNGLISESTTKKANLKELTFLFWRAAVHNRMYQVKLSKHALDLRPAYTFLKTSKQEESFLGSIVGPVPVFSIEAVDKDKSLTQPRQDDDFRMWVDCIFYVNGTKYSRPNDVLFCLVKASYFDEETNRKMQKHAVMACDLKFHPGYGDTNAMNFFHVQLVHELLKYVEQQGGDACICHDQQVSTAFIIAEQLPLAAATQNLS